MDSREIYNAIRFLKTKINWQNDWIYFGEETELKLEFVENLIQDYFDEKEILLLLERTSSKKISKDEIFREIKPMLGKENFELWTKSMKKAIQFNKVGVLNLGILEN